MRDDGILNITTFHLQKGDNIYHISLFNLEDRTEVRVIKSVSTLNNPPILIEIGSLVNGITPQNALDKLQTLLVFS